jgi:hypothetical protein
VRWRVTDQTTNIVLFGEMGFMERGRRHIIFILHLCMLYTFYRLCANETDLLSVAILSLTAAIIALQPAHHKVSMNNI